MRHGSIAVGNCYLEWGREGESGEFSENNGAEVAIQEIKLKLTSEDPEEWRQKNSDFVLNTFRLSFVSNLFCYNY
jgi:hypothetical protein